jgi:hypothetical protein
MVSLGLVESEISKLGSGKSDYKKIKKLAKNL